MALKVLSLSVPARGVRNMSPFSAKFGTRRPRVDFQRNVSDKTTVISQSFTRGDGQKDSFGHKMGALAGMGVK